MLGELRPTTERSVDSTAVPNRLKRRVLSFVVDVRPDKGNEICQLETMEARCRWNSEVIVMTSARWGRMTTGRCLNIDPRRLAANRNDPMFLGCSEDVLSILDTKCSSKPACDVAVPNADLDTITPCYRDLTRYLEASYTCVKCKLFKLTIALALEPIFTYVSRVISR